MLRFEKGPQPDALTEWQATPNADWSSVTSEHFWEPILDDQSFLCAYCQRVIPMKVATGKGMHVEHWVTQSSGSQSLDWGNLLGVCPGDETAETGMPRGERHCDTSRRMKPLFLHPVEGRGPSPIDHLAYTTEGEAVAERSPVADRVTTDIDTLNLSADRLMRGRVIVYESLKALLDRKGWTEGNLRRAYREYDAVRGGRRRPYAEVARYYLRRWAKKKNVTL
jgi:uncharacterized protein (TIGR02646 family)